MRYGMVIDLNRCVGCYSCVAKCKQEHFLPPGMTWGKLLISETGPYPNTTKHAYPVLCNHCKEPACVEACPTNATRKRDDGLVWVEQTKCTGCKQCVTACPYQMRTFYGDRKEYFPGQGATEYEKLADKLRPLKNDIVVKCDFCADRIDAGVAMGLKPGADRDATPACVNICPAKARFFGDLDDPGSEVPGLVRDRGAAPLHPGFGTDPSVFYILSPGLRNSRLLSRFVFSASARFSLPFFLTTAKRVRREAESKDRS